jgi:hypothetical protein
MLVDLTDAASVMPRWHWRRLRWQDEETKESNCEEDDGGGDEKEDQSGNVNSV